MQQIILSHYGTDKDTMVSTYKGLCCNFRVGKVFHCMSKVQVEDKMDPPSSTSQSLPECLKHHRLYQPQQVYYSFHAILFLFSHVVSLCLSTSCV